MNTEAKEKAHGLFLSILELVRAIETQPDPVGEIERRIRDRQRNSIAELLSIKGFFRAWCGRVRYSPEINLQMLGFDRDHPVVKGSALVSALVPRAFMEQRAWTEAMRDFKASNLPSAGDITRLLRDKKSKQQIAAQLGIGLSTVYKILNRGRRQRRRYVFGAD